MSPQELNQLREYLPFIFGLAAFFLLWCGLLHASSLRYLRFERQAEPREPPLWGAAEVALTLAAWFLIQLAVSPWMGQLTDSGAISESAYLLFAESLTALVVLLCIYHVVRGQLGQPLAAAGFAGATWRNTLPVLLLCALVQVPLIALQSLWLGFLHDVGGFEPVRQEVVDRFQKGAAAGDDWSTACFLFTGVVLAPIVEEALFRGLLFTMLRERWGSWAAALASSLMFAALHFTLTSFLPLVVVGCILCYVYVRTGSLYFPMLFHATFNGVAFLQILLSREGKGPG